MEYIPIDGVDIAVLALCLQQPLHVVSRRYFCEGEYRACLFAFLPAPGWCRPVVTHARLPLRPHPLPTGLSKVKTPRLNTSYAILAPCPGCKYHALSPSALASSNTSYMPPPQTLPHPVNASNTCYRLHRPRLCKTEHRPLRMGYKRTADPCRHRLLFFFT